MEREGRGALGYGFSSEKKRALCQRASIFFVKHKGKLEDKHKREGDIDKGKSTLEGNMELQSKTEYPFKKY
jgi:hypothetical protein